MQFLRFFFIVILLQIFFSHGYADECVFICEDTKVLVSVGDCSTRYTPASTFKLALCVMGFDSNVFKDETHPSWDFKREYVDFLPCWKQPHTPSLWLKNSCVWFSQVLTKKLGMELFNQYVQLFEYGNCDTSGDSSLNNGLTECWLSSSLRISPLEQITFLKKLANLSLPVSRYAQEATKKCMPQEKLGNGWTLFGKTGNGYQSDLAGNPQVGWFVGFICKGIRCITFVQLLTDRKPQESYASLRAKERCLVRVQSLLDSIEGRG